jgi:hypothetical protein
VEGGELLQRGARWTSPGTKQRRYEASLLERQALWESHGADGRKQEEEGRQGILIA